NDGIAFKPPVRWMRAGDDELAGSGLTAIYHGGVVGGRDTHIILSINKLTPAEAARPDNMAHYIQGDRSTLPGLQGVPQAHSVIAGVLADTFDAQFKDRDGIPVDQRTVLFVQNNRIYGFSISGYKGALDQKVLSSFNDMVASVRFFPPGQMPSAAAPPPAP